MLREHGRARTKERQAERSRKVARGCRATWHGRATLCFRRHFGLAAKVVRGSVFLLAARVFPGGKTLLFRPYIKRVKPRF